MDESEEKSARDMGELVAEVADGIARHLPKLARIDGRLPGVLRSGNMQAFETMEAQRAELLREVRDAYEVLMETSELLRVPHHLPPPLPASRSRSTPASDSLPRALERLRGENSVARRVRDFMDEDLLLIEDENEFLDDQEWARSLEH